MKRCDLSQYHEPAPTSPTTTVGWVYAHPLGQLKHEVAFDLNATTSVSPEVYRTEFVFRILCHALIDSLPIIALKDAAENLGDLTRQYMPRATTIRALPTSSTPKLQGRLGSPQQRRPLRFPEE